MALKRGKGTNYTYQGFALVDETHYSHAGGCFSNRKFVRETPDLVTYMPLRAQRSTPECKHKITRCFVMPNAIQTHPMSGHHGEANRCPAEIRHY